MPSGMAKNDTMGPSDIKKNYIIEIVSLI